MTKNTSFPDLFLFFLAIISHFHSLQRRHKSEATDNCRCDVSFNWYSITPSSQQGLMGSPLDTLPEPDKTPSLPVRITVCLIYRSQKEKGAWVSALKFTAIGCNWWPELRLGWTLQGSEFDGCINQKFYQPLGKSFGERDRHTYSGLWILNDSFINHEQQTPLQHHSGAALAVYHSLVVDIFAFKLRWTNKGTHQKWFGIFHV